MEHAPNTFRDFGSQLLSLAAYQSVLCGTSPLQLEHINFARTAHARVESSPANDTVYVRMCICIFVRVGVCVSDACVRARASGKGGKQQQVIYVNRKLKQQKQQQQQKPTFKSKQMHQMFCLLAKATHNLSPLYMVPYLACEWLAPLWISCASAFAVPEGIMPTGVLSPLSSRFLHMPICKL